MLGFLDIPLLNDETVVATGRIVVLLFDPTVVLLVANVFLLVGLGLTVVLLDGRGLGTAGTGFSVGAGFLDGLTGNLDPNALLLLSFEFMED